MALKAATEEEEVNLNFAFIKEWNLRRKASMDSLPPEIWLHIFSASWISTIYVASAASQRLISWLGLH
jgi:hypothetical protein